MNSLLWTTWLKTAGKSPKAAVIIEASAGRSMSIPNLTAAAFELASALEKTRGRVVAFSLPNTSQWMVLFLALQKVGAAALPLDSSLSAEAQRETAHSLGAHFLFESDRLILLGRGRPVPRDCACVKITSGTAGAAKPIYCSAKNLLADGLQIIRTMGIRPKDKNLAAIPLGHSYGLGNLVMPLILQGNPLVCAATFVPRQLLQWIGMYGVTVFPSVPAIFRILAEQRGIDSLKPLRLAISAGAPLPPETAKAFFERYGIKIHNFYGASETGGIAYDRTGRASFSGHSVGKPLHGVRISINSKGNVVVRSKAVVGSGSHTLPDLAQWGPQGELQLLGRTGAVANIGGKKVHPAEIERAILKIEGVSDAWVCVFQDSRGRDYLAAAVETKRAQADLESDLAKRVADWRLPRRYRLASSLPRTSRGKLDTAKLKALLDGSE